MVTAAGKVRVRVVVYFQGDDVTLIVHANILLTAQIL